MAVEHLREYCTSGIIECCHMLGMCRAAMPTCLPQSSLRAAPAYSLLEGCLLSRAGATVVRFFVSFFKGRV